MNLYKLSIKKWTYDQYDSFVVAAEAPGAASAMKPDDTERHPDETFPYGEELYVEMVGTTHLPSGTVVCASFNAG